MSSSIIIMMYLSFVDILQILYLSSKQEGLFRMGLSGLAFTPLNTIVPKSRAKELVSKQRKRIEERSNFLREGLREQYEIQLQALESGRGADIEFAHLAAFMSGVGMQLRFLNQNIFLHNGYGKALPEPGKAYTAIAVLINHPFTRGNVVRKAVPLCILFFSNLHSLRFPLSIS